jgi:hypothetical protein
VQQIGADEGVQRAFTSLVNERLAILCGAGLSMAAPSILPSAASIAAKAKQKYDAIHGAAQPALAPGIEDQAEFFFAQGELDVVYFRTLVDFHAFASRPNAGHHAVADLLLVGSLRAAVSTNVDVLVEAAGQYLYGNVATALDGHQIGQLPDGARPFLKLHGCFWRDRANMVWAKGQLVAPPVDARIASSAAWLGQNLAACDLVVVGYSTDWDYLNDVLARTLGAFAPATVIFVDVAEMATFQGKAPVLSTLGQRATVSALYVQSSGAEFLDRLRCKFSQSFVRQVLNSGADAYLALKGSPVEGPWLEPTQSDNADLWQLRRDLEGRRPGEPSQSRSPHDGESIVGLTLLQLRAKGATAAGSQWLLGDKRIRVVRASGTLLHQVAAAFERDEAPVVAPDFIIAAGAEGANLPTNVARAGEQSTIARGNRAQWLTRQEAEAEFNL